MTDPRVIKSGGGITAYSTKNGAVLREAEHSGTVQPMIIDGVFYSPDAYDLFTGKPLTCTGDDKRVSLRAGSDCSTYSG